MRKRASSVLFALIALSSFNIVHAQEINWRPHSSRPIPPFRMFAIGPSYRRAPLSLAPENKPADITGLTLGRAELVKKCDANVDGREEPINMSVDVTTEAKDLENDVLTYNYSVSGGKIKGTGARVVWDLSNVIRSDTYTITAAVDDGCGFCGKTMTLTLKVKLCPKDQ